MRGAGDVRGMILGAAASALISLAASAQPTQSVEALVKMLDSSDLGVRETATAQLAQGDRFPLASIEKALTDTTLSAEQRQRLRWAGQQLFARAPRAALGVSFVEFEESSTAVAPVEGFDSARVLRPGDTLTSVAGHRVVTQLEARQAIISNDPGDQITLGIIRAGTPMTVTVKMGRLADLRRGDRGPDAQTLNGAWSFRLARLGEPRPAPVESPLTFEQWRDAAERLTLAQAGRQEQMNDPFSGEPVRSVMNRPPVSDLAVGGQTRQSRGDEGMLIVQRNNGPIIIQRGLRPNGVPFRDQAAFDRVERDNLISQRDQLLRQIEANKARISDPNLPEPVRTSLKAQNDQAANVIQNLEARIQLLSRAPEVRP